MVIPTKEQLKLLYPNISEDYLSDCISRQLTLIEIENQIISEVDVIIDAYIQRIVGAIDEINQSNDFKKQQTIEYTIDKLLNELKTKLSEIEVDGMIQMHETSANLYQWILDKYFCNSAYEEIGGEQKKSSSNKVSRGKFTKQKAKSIVNTKSDSKKTVGADIDAILDDFKDEILQLYVGKDVPTNRVRKFGEKAKQRIKNSTQYTTQQVAYDAIDDVEFDVSDEYEVVYYRVEVLDSDICLSCLYIDGTINKAPIGLMHRNCRGIDVVLLRDENGKYYDTTMSGYGHKLKTSSFDTKFKKLSQKQQRRMLGKANYEYYKSGKLKIDDFMSYGRQITKAEADMKVDIKTLRKKMTPSMATRLSNQMEKAFKHSVDKMNEKELKEYEKVLGYQKQLYSIIPKSKYGKTGKQSYIDNIDAKYEQIQARKEKLKGVIFKWVM